MLIGLAGLLRPEAWAIGGLYFVWMAWRGTWLQRLRYLVYTVIPPAIWMLTDKIVAEEWLFSFVHTTGTSTALERDASPGEVPGLTIDFLATLVRPTVAVMGAVGVVIAVVLARRRALVPGVLLAAGIGAFLVIGFAGFTAVERYLLISAVALTIFAAVAVAGWTLLRPGTGPPALRPVWMAVGPVLIVVAFVFTSGPLFGVEYTADTVAQRTKARKDLKQILEEARPEIEQGLKCGDRISVPTHRMVPEVRWLLDLPDRDVSARSDRTVAAAGKTQQGVAIVIRSRELMFNPIYDIRPDPGDPEPVLHVWYRWDKVAENESFAVLVRCPKEGIGKPDPS
jgi:hypothetical protein